MDRATVLAVLDLATKAGVRIGIHGEHVFIDDDDLMRFAELVAAHEREACAKIAIEIHRGVTGGAHAWAFHAAVDAYVNSIRARAAPGADNAAREQMYGAGSENYKP